MALIYIYLRTLVVKVAATYITCAICIGTNLGEYHLNFRRPFLWFTWVQNGITSKHRQLVKMRCCYLYCELCIYILHAVMERCFCIIPLFSLFRKQLDPPPYVQRYNACIGGQFIWKRKTFSTYRETYITLQQCVTDEEVERGHVAGVEIMYRTFLTGFHSI